MKRWIIVLAVSLVGALAVPNVALAEGGASISTAPLVQLETPEEGTTSNGQHIDNGPSHGWNQFWNIRLKAGDLLIVNWEIATPGLDVMNIFPIGTGDFTFENKRPIAHKFIGSSTRAQLRWRVPNTGVYPLVIRTHEAEGTAYWFNARVKPRSKSK